MKKFIVVFIGFCLIFTKLQAQNKPSPEELARDRARNIRLPKSDWHYQRVKDYVEETPDDDYLHASEAAYEAFRDIKFSVRIHWGVYAMKHVEASWPLLAMTPADAAEYNQLYKKWNPQKFDPDGWMRFFKRIGAQCMAFTTKHTDGFSLFHTNTRVRSRINYAASTLEPDANTWKPGLYNSAPVWHNKGNPVLEECDLHYSVAESPYKQDIVKQLADAAHKHGIKIDFYFPHVDWYDADFRPYDYNPATRSEPQPSQKLLDEYANHVYRESSRTPEQTARFIARHREQLRELLTNYGKIDMLCLDEFLGADVWPELRKTVKMIRQLQPDIMIRNRGIGNYGDYYQPEQSVPAGSDENTGMPWMSICLLGDVFSFDPVGEHYKGAKWVIHNLIDCVAKGGSFMVCIGPDADGEFHPEAVRQLEEVGDWLRVNGQGIYETRFRDVWKSGDYYFTRSKDNKKVYAFTENIPDEVNGVDGSNLNKVQNLVKVKDQNFVKVTIPSVTPLKGSKVYMFGHKKPLKWQPEGDGVTVEIPSVMPSKYAIGFEFTVN
ncbi:MAG: alpha-L-fucosidase [Tannerella sp.]|jgi:alpha-L-fucosidase|nr:alpha-L-fucosidase [Tannerella sp.]